MANTTWTLGDVMRIGHPRGVDQSVGNFILRGEVTTESPELIRGFAEMQNAKTVKDVLAVLAEYKGLPWETIPTQFLKDVQVWRALFDNGALNGQALVRNVTRLARIGAFTDMHFAAAYSDRLTDEQMIARSRLHPMNYLNALVVHTEGQVDRRQYGYWGYGARKKDWTTSSAIVGALEDGFHKSFKYVEPAGKATLLALDVSASMGSMASGLDLTCSQVSAAMAMTVARTEPAHEIRGFSTTFKDLGITKNQGLNEVMRKVANQTFGGTDCSQPMEWALKNRVKVETFVVFTDSETYAGRRKPVQALRDYRARMGIPARLVVVGLNSTGFTIADPTDAGMLDVVGGDSNLPRIISDFSAGRI